MRKNYPSGLEETKALKPKGQILCSGQTYMATVRICLASNRIEVFEDSNLKPPQKTGEINLSKQIKEKSSCVYILSFTIRYWVYILSFTGN
jgi:hypothetical protein